MIIVANFEPTKPYLVPSELTNMIENLYYRLTNAKNDDEKLNAIIQSHIKFERIHPFSDGNGRIGRLLMIYSCLEQNLIPIIIPKEQKERYIAYLRNNDIDSFVEFAKEIQEQEEKRQLKFSNQKELSKVRRR